MEDDKIFSENPVVAEKLNNFFLVAAQSIEIEPFVLETYIEAFKGSLDEIIKQYESHPSIFKIWENVKIGEKFTFKDINPKDISQRINDLDSEKAGVENDVPAKILIGR